MTCMIIYDARIMINRNIILVILGRTALPALANLSELQQYLSNQHLLRRAHEVMKLSSNPAEIQSYRTQLRWIRDEP